NSGTGTLGVWINGQQTIKTNLISNKENVIVSITFTPTSASARTSINYYHYPQGSAGTSSVEWACLYEADEFAKLPLNWIPSNDDIENEFTSLDGRLTTAESSLTVQANQIASKVSTTEFNSF